MSSACSAAAFSRSVSSTGMSPMIRPNRPIPSRDAAMFAKSRAQLDHQAQAIRLADDHDVAVLQLGARDPAARDVVDVRPVRRALIDRDELAAVDADPD